MKHRKKSYIAIGTLVFSILIVVTVLAAAHLATWQSRKTDKVTTCQQQGATHTVTIQSDAATPSQTTAKVCDRLTIINRDQKTRLIAFGEHSHHTKYGNVEEALLADDKSMTIVLKDPGYFKFHDHLDDAARGTFTVENK